MSKHQKRIAAPRNWYIGRKEHYWAVKTSPGPHPKERSIPLLLIVRDMLKLADNTKEAKRILHEGNVLVNGKIIKKHKFPVGIFDILSIPSINANYMILMDNKEKLRMKEIEEKEADRKLCRVNNKRMVKGGKIQLNLHDSRNLILHNELSKEIKTKDSLMISLQNNEILEHWAYKEGSKVMVIGGKHSAQIGEIVEIRILRSSEPNIVRLKPLNLKDEENGFFETIEDYVFVIGENKIEMPGLSMAG